MSLRIVSTQSWAALVIGILAAIVRVHSLQTTTVNGAVTSCTYTDFGGMALGAITLIVALAAIRDAMSSVFAARGWSRRDATIAVAVLALGLGVYGILKGLAIVASPCTDLLAG